VKVRSGADFIPFAISECSLVRRDKDTVNTGPDSAIKSPRHEAIQPRCAAKLRPREAYKVTCGEGRGFRTPSVAISAPIPYILRLCSMKCSFRHRIMPPSSSLMSNCNWPLLILHPLLNDIFPLLSQVPCITHTKAMLEDFSNLL
jgi:hypothetical protein